MSGLTPLLCEDRILCDESGTMRRAAAFFVRLLGDRLALAKVYGFLERGQDLSMSRAAFSCGCWN